MKIKELINILETSLNKERNVYIESISKTFTTDIDISFDDNNDIQIYEIAKEMSKISNTEIEFE
jgi:hypothetical protein